MDGPFDLIEHVLVGSSEDYGAGSGFFAAFEENKVVIADSFLDNFFALSQVRRVEHLVAFGSGESVDDGGSGQTGDSVDISLVDSAETQAAGLEHVFGGCIVDAHGGDDDVGSGFDDFGYSGFEDVALFLSDFFEVFGVVDKDLNAELQSEFM